MLEKTKWGMSVHGQHPPPNPPSALPSRRKRLLKEAVADHCSSAESGGVTETANEKNGNSEMEIVSSETANSGDTV